MKHRECKEQCSNRPTNADYIMKHHKCEEQSSNMQKVHGAMQAFTTVIGYQLHGYRVFFKENLELPKMY